jgi:glycerophosphoryl diester phosphodiesterase
MAVLSGRHPRNSLAAIAECLEARAIRIELDVHSLDGPDHIVCHGSRFESDTTGGGAIGRATPADVRQLRFRDHPEAGPPLLSEVVDLARTTGTELQLDWKDLRLISMDRLGVLAAVVAPMRERVIVSAGQDWNLRRLHEVAPHVPFGFDPGHYLDHRHEETDVMLPRAIGAYGYRDDHPLAIARGEQTADYLAARMEMLSLQAPAAREHFLNYRLVLQMLDDGFNPAASLHERATGANVWTVDLGRGADIATMQRLIAADIDRVATNTGPAWIAAFDALA